MLVIDGGVQVSVVHQAFHGFVNLRVRKSSGQRGDHGLHVDAIHTLALGSLEDSIHNI